MLHVLATNAAEKIKAEASLTSCLSSSARIQPVPDLGASSEPPPFAHGIIPLEQGMVCFLDLDHLFAGLEVMPCAA